MPLDARFAYTPTTPIVGPAPAPIEGDPLGPLADLVGHWEGSGFNAIWRPNHDPGSDHFLELNVTHEILDFDRIPGNIPNRGLLQADLTMTGIRYLQQIFDVNVKDSDGRESGLHVEPGVWLSVPATTNPMEPSTVVRMGSIPHGTTILAQGTAIPAGTSGPIISPVSLSPFPIGQPGRPLIFAEQTLTNPSQFRSPNAAAAGITQAMLDNPNSVLVNAIAGMAFTNTTALIISSDASAPVLGGGTENTAFLQGTPSAGPNADAVIVTAIFWIETRTDGKLQLQYTQTVLLNFNGISWPHISVATLLKA